MATEINQLASRASRGTMTSTFTALDWLMFVMYFVLLALTGWWINSSGAKNSQEYFIGSNSMPTWLAAISVLATAQSAATFLGGPDSGYRSNLTYLASNIGALMAAFFVGYFLIPRFYRYKVSTVYELLELRFGSRAKKQAGLMYLFGRIFANGARLYMAAIAVSMILFTDIALHHVIWSIALLCLVSLLYSIFGGIKSVIYGDTFQCFVYVGAAVLVLLYLWSSIPADFSTVWQALENPPHNAASKLTLIDTSWDFSSANAFTLYSSVTGLFLLYIASFGLDQDLTQRALTCRNARQGSLAIIWSVVLVIPVTLVFMLIGFLLYIFYQRPDLMAGSGAVMQSSQFSGENITVFMYYVLHEMPAGLRGLVTVGVIAAAVSTLTSGLNSMASVIIQDLYKPWQQQRHTKNEQYYVRAARVSMLFCALALALMAMLCFYWQQSSDMPLLTFALGVMVFSYSGLLGVYASALFSQRGSPTSVLAALLGGFVITLLMQPYLQRYYLPTNWQFDLAFSWQLCIGFACSFVICQLGKSSDAVAQKELNGVPA
jgi:SSS family transporter